MNVEMEKFGKVLMSHPAGREAFLMAKAYVFDSLKPEETLYLDFSNVKVLAPSWAEEFVIGIKSNYKNKIEYVNTDNETVIASLKTILR